MTDEEIKAEFPIFEKKKGKPFHYLDSAMVVLVILVILVISETMQ